MIRISEKDFNFLVWTAAKVATQYKTMATIKDGDIISENVHHLTDATVETLRTMFTAVQGKGNVIFNTQCKALVGFLESEMVARNIKVGN